MPQHVFESAGPPNSAPTKVGSHWVDTSTKDTYISVGTSSAADWVRIFPFPAGASWRLKEGNMQFYNVTAALWHTVYLVGTPPAVQWAFGPGEA